jgi:hypothetical protein
LCYTEEKREGKGMQMGTQQDKKLWKVLAFHVHSDRNPDPKSQKLASERITKIMDNKFNEVILLKCAREWGIDIPQAKNSMPSGLDVLYTGSFVDVLWRQDENKVAFSGYIVDFIKNSITDNIKVYICQPDGKIRVIYVASANINILRGKVDNLQAYGAAREAYNDFVMKAAADKKKKDTKEKRDKNKENFKKVGLKANTNYKYNGLKMDYDGIWYNVVRTTSNKVILVYCGTEIKISIENANKVYA